MTMWSLVLAAGQGRRLSSVTGGVPKQFWSPDGGPSLIEETVARFGPVVPDERVVTVVGASHRAFVNAIEARRSLGEVMYQPRDAGTASGALLGLSAIIAHDPEAHVLMTPSDHGIRDPHALLSGVLVGANAVGRGQSKVVLFGVQPLFPAGDFGWIAPAPRRERSGRDTLRKVAAFVEKPAPDLAARLFESGAVWNTMVMIAHAQVLLDLYRNHLPATAATFERAFAGPASSRDRRLDEAYRQLTPADFSRDLLTPSSDLDFYTWTNRLGWTDLGTPDRLAAWCAGPEATAVESVGLSAAS